MFHSTSNTAKDSHEASGSTYVSLRFLKRFYRDAYARLRAVLRPETVIVFHDGFRLLRWGGWFRRAGMRNVMLDTHQYLIAMEDPLFSGPARRLYLRSRRLPWLYRMLVGASGIAIRSAARRIPVLVGECAWRISGPYTAKTDRLHIAKCHDCNVRHGTCRRDRSIGATSLRAPRNRGSGEGKPPRDPRNGGNLEAWDLTRVWRHGWIRADTSHDDMP